MADTPDLGSGAVRRGGSSPPSRTKTTMQIEAYCRTNMDGYEREEWPREFAVIPKLGEWVEAKSKRCLKVAQITHKYDFFNKKPFIEVELTNGRNGATL